MCSGVWFCSCLIPWLKIMVLCLLAVDWNRMSWFTRGEEEKNVLVWLVCWWLVVSSCLSFSPSSASSFALLLSLLRGLRPGTGACILLSLSRLSLDDLTMPPYSPHPLPPMTPLSGNINICLAETKCWLWLVLLFFSSFLLLLFLSVLLLRDTDQVNRALHTTLHPRERLVVSPFWRSRPLGFFFFSFVFISLTAIFRFGQLRFSGFPLETPSFSFSRDYSDL